MSALNWAIDMGQSSAISTLEESVEALEKDMETARAWIEHLTKRIEELENERTIERIGSQGKDSNGE